ncbi:hypothetical protein FXE09_02130 [Aggregatibacter actinomycetemcomitans]|nr:hypothetical protein FXE09_02130 [Aggregatibacter actinomycetemcomitans]
MDCKSELIPGYYRTQKCGGKTRYFSTALLCQFKLIILDNIRIKNQFKILPMLLHSQTQQLTL